MACFPPRWLTIAISDTIEAVGYPARVGAGMSRIFISHSSADSFAAIAFHDWLLAEGWAKQDVIIDLHDLNAGERWKDALASPSSLASTECLLKLRLAECPWAP